MVQGERQESATVAAVCDINPERLELAKKELNLDDSQLFSNEADFFAAGKFGELCVVSSPDNCHKRHAQAAMSLGYDLHLEKPIACTKEDCIEIYDKAKELDRNVFVCHVLRYAPFFSDIKTELMTGKYGKISTINLTENVAYWHQAHSYVRGNWRNTKTSSPMIIAKCCHDIDILCWLVDASCTGVSSMGALNYFTKANAPQNSGERCVDCPAAGDCIYNAEKFYLELLRNGEKGWPINVLAAQPTEESIFEAVKNGPYGRCVYKCDNDAVDHQVVNLEFEGGITAHLTMTAFSQSGYREIHIHGEKGEIYGSLLDNRLHCNIYGKENKIINVNTKMNNDFGHGGGDYFLVKDIIDFYHSGGAVLTSIDKAMASHI